MPTRLEEYGVPFIDSEHAFLKLQEGLNPFIEEMEELKKLKGQEYVQKIAEYLFSHRLNDLPSLNKDTRIVLVNYTGGRCGIPIKELINCLRE